jgi:hypothetical protein
MCETVQPGPWRDEEETEGDVEVIETLLIVDKTRSSGGKGTKVVDVSVVVLRTRWPSTRLLKRERNAQSLPRHDSQR